MPKQAWHRREEETTPAYDAFMIYCELPYVQKEDRSYKRVAHLVNKSLTIIGRWGGAHEWQERIKAYDAWMQETRDKAVARSVRDEILTMHEKHRKIAAVMIGKVVEALQEIPGSTMNVQEVLRMFELAVKIEKEATGQPSQITEQLNTDAGKRRPMNDVFGDLQAWWQQEQESKSGKSKKPGNLAGSATTK